MFAYNFFTEIDVVRGQGPESKIRFQLCPDTKPGIRKGFLKHICLDGEPEWLGGLGGGTFY